MQPNLISCNITIICHVNNKYANNDLKCSEDKRKSTTNKLAQKLDNTKLGGDATTTSAKHRYNR